MARSKKIVNVEIEINDLVEVVSVTKEGTQTQDGFVGRLDNIWTENGVTKYAVVADDYEDEWAVATEIKLFKKAA